MSPPVRKGDGTSVVPQEIAEVRTGDGRVLFGGAIPDSGDLHAHFDATQLSLSDQDSVSTWTDETGNGHDLTAGSDPTYATSGINGNPALQFDEDYLDVDFSDISQPYTIFAVVDANDDTSQRLYDGFSSFTPILQYDFDSNSYFWYAGSSTRDGAPSANPEISGVTFDGAASSLRTNGSQVGQSDIGTQAMDGLTVGARYDQTKDWFNGAVGEILIYPQDKSGIASDVELYLSDKWGITI